MQGTIVGVCVSDKRGPKQQASTVRLIRGHGIENDVHAGNWHRQVSILTEEKIDEMRARGLELTHGAFGENLITRGFDLTAVRVGQKLRIGKAAVVQLTQRGKTCHTRCAIFYQTGDCIMPTDGTFVRVLKSGSVEPGDAIAMAPDLDQVHVAVVTLSDRAARGEREDLSGPAIEEALRHEQHGLAHAVVTRIVMSDDRKTLEKKLIDLCEDDLCDLILTTGGTGLSSRDMAPEATRAVIDREIPGMAEAIRAKGLAHTHRAMLSRAVCGQRGPTIIVNLSGSPKAATEQLGVILPVLSHAIQTASGIPQDCAR
ncbi:MAG: hypothetical protein A2289_11610 [Deltaproteobacteria bacterium RIFOXYA12_FULL_58_15]|nr:MAG: hypothetical protein A2289_11610 [Deltaproteobacteria bacterium RIFOXYA12_FULL_58_15]